MNTELLRAHALLREAMIRRELARIDLIIAARAVRTALNLPPKVPAALGRQAE